ncbi:hypothetical protein KA001_00980 [Patescibacteria group bacterium]|nr:hypothetical protein [Patescibacteria group bacterium]
MEQLTAENIKEASKLGEQSATKALSVLAKKSVSVQTTDVSLVDATSAKLSVEELEEHAVIAYMEALSGVTGVSVLALKRQNALDLVDAFNNRPKGTTIVLQELDRSTVRETLNILANAYITEVAKYIKTTILLSVPKITTKDKLNEIAQLAGVAKGGSAVLFQTKMSVEDTGFDADLYFFFVTNLESK